MKPTVGEYYKCLCGCDDIFVVKEINDDPYVLVNWLSAVENDLSFDMTDPNDWVHLPNYKKTLKTQEEIQELVK